MGHNNIFKKWDDAHVSYEERDYFGRRKVPDCDQSQHRKMVERGVNGNLLINNSFFKTLENNKKIFLAHITPKLSQIITHRSIQPSGGCLVGSIYCTQLFKEGKIFRIHNLGRYILNKEAPWLLNRTSGSLGSLIIEIDLKGNKSHNLKGIDYLRLGEIHFDKYKKLEHLLSYRERKNLEKICTDRIKKSLNYLAFCGEVFRSSGSNSNIAKDRFIRKFIENIDRLPILGYFYFEAISEYIMLYQDNYEAIRYKELGEFYVPSFKNLVPAQFSKLSSGFSLGKFKPSLKFLLQYFSKNKIFKVFVPDHFISYLVDKIIFLTNTRLLSDEKTCVNFNNTFEDFDNLSRCFKPLLGHLIYRELRSFGRYPDFYFYFDQNKAIDLWNYWNCMNITIPFNGVIPKGELGINPANPDLKYKFYSCDVENGPDDSYFQIDKELNIKIEPMLVNLRHTFMRSGDNISRQESIFRKLYERIKQ